MLPTERLRTSPRVQSSSLSPPPFPFYCLPRTLKQRIESQMQAQSKLCNRAGYENPGEKNFQGPLPAMPVPGNKGATSPGLAHEENSAETTQHVLCEHP